MFPTIGFISGWQTYERTMLLDYYHLLLQGIARAALEYDCNLLLSCGMSPSTYPIVVHPAWPVPGAGKDFVPVGAWNTDGLIVAHPLTDEAAVHDIESIVADGHPVVFVGGRQPFPTVRINNRRGIHEALSHLLDHGHRSIAFIAGHPMDKAGDSGERLRAYQSFVRRHGLVDDPRLIAYGDYVLDGGQQAMRTILQENAPFTAVLASNDESAFGAILAIKEKGLRVPEDIAVIGFDDAPDSILRQPPLTSVRVPIFDLGRRALETVLALINGAAPAENQLSVSPRLVIRQSCGCQPAKATWHPSPSSATANVNGAFPPSAQQLADHVYGVIRPFVRRMKDDEILALCDHLSIAFVKSCQTEQPALFVDTVHKILQTVTSFNDDVYAWWQAIGGIENQVDAAGLTGGEQNHVAHILNLAKEAIVGAMRREYRHYLESQRLQANQMGLLSSRLHGVLDMEEVYSILAAHLPEMGIHHMAVAFFEKEAEDSTAHSALRIVVGEPRRQYRFPSRSFPLPSLYSREEPFQLALLPLGDQDGYVVFDTSHLEMYSAITQQIRAAMKIVRLYKEALDGRQTAEEANMMKSRFLSMVSHELQTPLRVIIGASGQLLESAQSEADYVGLSHMNASAHHLESLIGDVLDLTRSDMRQLSLTWEQFRMDELLHRVSLIGEQLASEKGLHWLTDIQADLPLIWGDPARLQQVVLNLINNAIKFTDAGSVQLRAEAMAESLVVAIADTGLGVPKAEQKLIFEEFQQSKRAAQRSYAGLGLGLAISKQLVEMHGGAIGVHSSGIEGGGATFFFTVPLNRRPAADGKARQAAVREPSIFSDAMIAANSLKTILVVDDEPAMLSMHAQMIAEDLPAVRVLQAGSGREALQLLQTVRPDLILLDLMMAELDGFGVLEAMGRQETYRTIPVVVLTGRALTESDMERLRGRVTAVLNKGLFRMDEIIAQLQQSLRQQAGLAEETRDVVRTAVAYIHQHYDEPLNRAVLADYVGVSPSYFSRCFHQEMGIPYREYLNRYRINRARILLGQGAGSVTDVAYQVGFQNISYFSQVFRQVVGVSPNDYRKSMR